METAPINPNENLPQDVTSGPNPDSGRQSLLALKVKVSLAFLMRVPFDSSQNQTSWEMQTQTPKQNNHVMVDTLEEYSNLLRLSYARLELPIENMDHSVEDTVKHEMDHANVLASLNRKFQYGVMFVSLANKDNKPDCIPFVVQVGGEPLTSSEKLLLIAVVENPSDGDMNDAIAIWKELGEQATDEDRKNIMAIYEKRMNTLKAILDSSE